MSETRRTQSDLAGLVNHCGLPAGVSQRDCEGPPDPLADADGPELWRACDPAQQEAIATRFADRQRDDVRDAILEVEDRRLAARSAESLGQILWRSWIEFRDQNLRELHRRGQIQSPVANQPWRES